MRYGGSRVVLMPRYISSVRGVHVTYVVDCSVMHLVSLKQVASLDCVSFAAFSCCCKVPHCHRHFFLDVAALYLKTSVKIPMLL